MWEKVGEVETRRSGGIDVRRADHLFLSLTRTNNATKTDADSLYDRESDLRTSHDACSWTGLHAASKTQRCLR